VLSAPAIFLSSFLVFQIQPIAAKAILPLHGGTPAVWTVCLLFFQLLLVAGYAYAHFTRPVLHALLLVGSLAFLPVQLRVFSAPDPTHSVLVTLFLTAAGPYFLTAASSPLLQRWSGIQSPYRLYALSNAASLSALLSYPILVEPWLTLRIQFLLWSGLYVFFVLFSLAAVLKSAMARRATPPTPERPGIILWIAVSACGTALLAATTNQICLEIAPIPFLWIVPLSIYLLTFILAFERPSFYERRLFSLLASVTIPIACALTVLGLQAPVWVHMASGAAVLFACLMLLHGELAASKPAPGHLTRFYIAIAAGGALGSAFVALAAPRLFSSFAEFPLSLAACAALSLLYRWRAGDFTSLRQLPPIARTSLTGLAFAVIVPFLVFDAGSSKTIAQTRNFYGVLRVTKMSDPPGPRRILTHGQTTHGSQFHDDRRSTPTAYYGYATAPGFAFQSRSKPVLHAGLIGLGVGTLAAYGKPGDRFRFYEINPEVIRIANSRFSYLKDSAASITLVEGDARTRLREEPPQNFDLLIVDAFSSDAIPTHLLTRECADLYKRHLASDGKLLFHISNRTLDLEPVVRSLAHHLRFSAFRLDSSADPDRLVHAATWMILESRGRLQTTAPLLWTDDYTSLWTVLK